jgi:antitoxin HigA-1
MVADTIMGPVHPGEILLEEFLKPLSVSQYHLAKEIGVPARRVNEIVHGQRRISADTALRLARFSARRFAFTLWATAGNWSLTAAHVSYLLSSARPSPDGRVCASAAVVRRPR